MYKELLEEQLERLRKCQKSFIGDYAAVVQLSSMIQETAARLEYTDNTTAEETELSYPMQKEELLEDFSNEELVRELEKRGAANVYRTDDKNLFVFTGNFYTD